MLTLTSVFSLELNSGKAKVSLLELYTSESCSSCPPAEKFISKFRESDLLWKKIVPVSFHIAYWNHLSVKLNDKFTPASMELDSPKIMEDRKYTCFAVLLKNGEVSAITSGENNKT